MYHTHTHTQLSYKYSNKTVLIITFYSFLVMFISLLLTQNFQMEMYFNETWFEENNAESFTALEDTRKFSAQPRRKKIQIFGQLLEIRPRIFSAPSQLDNGKWKINKNCQNCIRIWGKGK